MAVKRTVKASLAYFAEKTQAKTFAEVDQRLEALFAVPEDVDDVLRALRCDPASGKIERRGFGDDHDPVTSYARQAFVLRAPASKAVDAFRAEVTTLQLGTSWTSHDRIEVSDEVLARFPALRDLRLHSVDRLPALPALTGLTVSYASLEELDLAAYPALERLELSSLPRLRRIRGWGPALAKLTLIHVEALGTLALGEAVGLTEIDAPQAKITLDLTGLTRLKKVACDFPGRDLSMLADARELESLTGSGAELVSLHGLEGHHQLAELSLHQDSLSDLRALKGLRSLRELRLGGSFTSLEGLEKLPALAKLTVTSGALESLAPLSGCPALGLVDVGSCSRLKDISALAGLKLHTLWAMWTPALVDLGPLDGMKTLTKIHVHGNAKKSKDVPVSIQGALDPKYIARSIPRAVRAKRPAPRQATGAARNQVAKLKKLVLSRDLDAIDQGVELAVSLGDPAVFAALLDGVTVERRKAAEVLFARSGYQPANLPHFEAEYDVIVANSVFQHGALLRPMREHALRSLIARAPEEYAHARALRKKVRALLVCGEGKKYEPGPVSLAPLAAFPALRILSIDGATEVRGLEAVPDMPSLEILTFAWCRSLQELELRSRTLRELRLLAVTHLQTMTGELPALTRATYDMSTLKFPTPPPPISELALGTWELGPSDFDPLAALPTLEKLRLGYRRIKGEIPEAYRKLIVD